MTMTLPASPPAPANAASLDQILRVIVALVGVIEGMGGLIDLPTLFGDLSNIGLITLASIALHPLLGFAALIFALTRRLRTAIVALALLVLAKWASDMTSAVDHGLELSAGDDAFVIALMVSKIFVQPALSLAAVAAAWFNRYLTAATIAVMLPTIVDAAAIAAFAIAVSLHGF